MKTLLGILLFVITALGVRLVASDSPSPKVVGAYTMVRVFQRAIEQFHKDVGRYPLSEEGLDVLCRAPKKDAAHWKGPYLRAELPSDPWGNPYRYCYPAKKGSAAFDVW